MTKKIESQIKALGIYQIIGGVSGIALILYFTAKAANFNISVFQLTVFFLSFYAFSIYCGFLLIKRKYNKGLNFSIVNQALQIISFSVVGVTFQYISGAYFSLGLNLTKDTLITYHFGLTTFNFKINSNTEIAAFSINVVAMVLIHFLFNLKEKITDQKTEISQIGNHN